MCIIIIGVVVTTTYSRKDISGYMMMNNDNDMKGTIESERVLLVYVDGYGDMDGLRELKRD